MANQSGIEDASWRSVERIFSEEICKTPPVPKRAPMVPLAPRKPSRPPARRYVTLKPRRLDFEMESLSPPSQQSRDSAISLWFSSSASLGVNDVDKENRPLTRNSRKKRSRKGASKPEFRPMRI